MKIRPMRGELLRVDGRIDRQTIITKLIFASIKFENET